MIALSAFSVWFKRLSTARFKTQAAGVILDNQQIFVEINIRRFGAFRMEHASMKHQNCTQVTFFWRESHYKKKKNALLYQLELTI